MLRTFLIYCSDTDVSSKVTICFYYIFAIVIYLCMVHFRDWSSSYAGLWFVMCEDMELLLFILNVFGLLGMW